MTVHCHRDAAAAAFYAMTVPGLEKVAAREIESFLDAEVRRIAACCGCGR
jgi:hypothetical protein